MPLEWQLQDIDAWGLGRARAIVKSVVRVLQAGVDRKGEATRYKKNKVLVMGE